MNSQQVNIIEKSSLGEYFGQYGARALAYQEYKLSLFHNNQEEINSATLIYASILYDTFMYCVEQVKQFHLLYLVLGVIILWQLNEVLDNIICLKMYEQAKVSQKETLIKSLLLCCYLSPFSGYGKLAIKIKKSCV